MFTTLPDLTPRDSHSLWYRSSRSPYVPPGPLDDFNDGPHSQQHGTNQARQRKNVIERSLLARLAADEQYMQRRRLNVQNYGSVWLKPPGVPKTLHQMREEKREQEEHQEAVRREQLAQELAEAEAEGAPGEEGTMDDVQLDGAQDLDDEIPDADEGYGFDDDEDDDDEEEEEEEEEEEGEEDGEETDDEAVRAERQNDLMAARMRMGDDAFREALVRGEPDANDMYGEAEEYEEEETNGQLLDEDDFAQDDDLGMDMDADLDEDIPEAESQGYEHTDSEAEVSSSEQQSSSEEDDEDDIDTSFQPRSTTLPPPLSPTFHGGRSTMSHPRASMDLSNLLSQDGSSFMHSSPVGRRARQ
ncbi:replicase poly 1a [Fusarium longipes]|uniref:Replicase poly 1a n=1 Tax=Fusarium longipes TaxID=694270 RepID=A0A395S6I8_9HYPO|nr:replicase poly 1a [Fusarium longipes]